MDITEFARAQVEHHEAELRTLYEQRAAAVGRKRVADDELARATAGSRAAALDLEEVDRMLAARIDLISHQNASLAPIHRLSQDILLLIFSATLPEPDLPSTPGGFDSIPNYTPSSFTVSAVCCGWRRLALSYPALWTSMHLDLTRSLKNLTEFSQTLLHRSGNLALCVRIFTHSAVDANSTRELENVLPKILSRSRWVQLLDPNVRARVSDPGGGPRRVPAQYSILKFFQLPTPRLQRLLIVGHHVLVDSAQLLPFTPVLQELRLFAYPLRNIPVAALRTLVDIRLSRDPEQEPTSMSFINAAAPRLRHLEIKGCLTRVAGPSPVTAPFVSLEVLCLDTWDRLSQFSSESLPAVTRLEIRFWTLDHVETIRVPSMPSLRAFRATVVSTWDGVIPVLGQLPQVETLTVSVSTLPSSAHTRPTSVLWRDWAVRGNLAILPRLHTLVLENVEFKEGDEVAHLFDFLEARAALERDVPTAPVVLERLILRQSGFPPWLVPRLEACVASVVIQTPNR
ncbi:hypothetical protein EXIGLDRAFT_841554 [Exidia glandulosa HHB12029]|uniref:F-box domain-containing protein n=1 Tax=Exidia glandulosa HHB12029 TaxID=1314781 RepID=A0A165DUA9_EXIGL|nr:hypothetical protein EXIGLDRAFT_841554 [Exidia glandulosa HHB12029]